MPRWACAMGWKFPLSSVATVSCAARMNRCRLSFTAAIPRSPPSARGFSILPASVPGWLLLGWRLMRFGSLSLQSNLFLSPLAGYTNLPFRLTLRELGGLDLATTDLVNARSLLEKNPKAFKLIETCPADRPLAVQLFGSVPEEMRD